MQICRYLLIPFSFIYLLIVSLRNIFYRLHIFKDYKLDAKVISVGNITWGGTGKTPLVAYIAEALLKRGLRPAILIRGYGRDEPELISKLVPGVPVVAGRDRVKTGREAIVKHSLDTLLLDDGFQHRRLKRDMDIVLIDAMNPFGNGLLIPAGSLREGLSSLKRASIFLITKVDLVKNQKTLQDLEDKLRKINPAALIAKSTHRPEHFYKLSDEQLVNLESLKDKDIALVSAIGNPETFRKTIEGLGLKAEKHFVFRDHHWYKEKELKKIEDWCSRNSIGTIITTEKDAGKIQNSKFKIQNLEFLVLSIKLKIVENEDAFLDRLSGVYSG